MRKSLSIFLVLICAVVSISVKAQSCFRYGVEAGFVSSHPSDYSDKAGTGYKVGVTGECIFGSPTQGWFIGSGLALTTKPWNSIAFRTNDFDENGEEMIYSLSEKTHPRYLQIPLQGGYRFPIGKGFGIQVQTGLFAAVGIGGKSTQHETIEWETVEGPQERHFENKVSVFGRSGFYRRFGWGSASSIGVSYKDQWQLKFNFDYQFNDFLKGDTSIHNVTWGMSIGYMF